MFKMPIVGWHTYLQSLVVIFHSVVDGFTQTKLTKMHFKTRELVLASVAAFVKTPAYSIVIKPDNPVDSSWVNWGHSSLAMKSRQSNLLKLETWNSKNDKYS